ncbi:hypothetical protein [Gimesia sp.]|uniref:hypothetical protein n=1 Tax=Gimesia sp. TaxID=2024833 RepID=UPI000C597D29|nr:hypothetical protein [Gimesia sp.]MAX37723.1 hypothetical protein [Gimesia sp.]HBL46179.1 hypothetical protein [Planctomycetaceae bacterium]|tara:strand:- start:8006 stop:9538 length:1533 start_codon:yes stop_codon:yes gene_type:complete
MAKKYLNLEEAAAELGMEKEELNRLREAGDIRGFADRGAWKFRMEDVEELGRSRQADSDPAIPLFNNEDLEDDDMFDSAILDDDDLTQESDSVIDEDEVGEQATVIRGSVHDDDDEPVELSSSDSDVRLVVDEGDDLQLDSEPELVAVGEDSDSDVRLTDDSSIDLGSDSDVKLVDGEQEPDFEVMDLEMGSDSDVKLVADDSSPKGSESDVALIGEDFDLGSDSDVALVSDESDESSILAEDSGLSLAEDSGISLASDSGISLAGPLDSGISLESADESGISLVDDDASGLSLEDDTGSDISITADSGISLEPFDSEDDEKTSPMVSTKSGKDATMEIPALDDDEDFADSSFDLEDSHSDTSVLMLNEDGDAGGSSGSVILDSDDEEGESAIFDDDEFASDDGLSDVFDEEDDFDDIYDADDDDFDDSFQSGESHAEFVAPASFAGGRGAAMAAPEAEWGVGTFVALGISTLLMSICGLMMYDLIRTMWHYDDPSAVSSSLLEMVRGLF